MDLPGKIIQVLRPFEEIFSKRVWKWAKVLLIGAILAPGERTVAAILRVMGLSTERHFQNYHRVLNRAKWSSRALSLTLLHRSGRTEIPPMFMRRMDSCIICGLVQTFCSGRKAVVSMPMYVLLFVPNCMRFG